MKEFELYDHSIAARPAITVKELGAAMVNVIVGSSLEVIELELESFEEPLALLRGDFIAFDHLICCALSVPGDPRCAPRLCS